MHLQLHSQDSEGHHHHHDHQHRGRGGFWRAICVLLLLAIGVFVLVRTVFFVDETEYVYVTQFGEPIRLYTEAGLGVKWPYQSLWRFDRRLQMYEPSGREMLTEDKENLNVQWYVCWRIPGRAFVQQQLQATAASPDTRVGESEFHQEIEKYVHRFLRSVGTVETAESRLEERIQAAVAAEIGHTRLQQLVSLDEEQLQLDAIAGRVSEAMRRTAAGEFGIEVVDVRLKRFSYPEAVKPAVYAEIRSERERIAVQYRAEGASQKAKIESLANLHRDQLLAQARRDATTIRGEGEAKAIEIFNAAHSKDPQFYELLKTLEAYRTILDDQTTVVLSADSPLLKLLTEGLPELPEGQPKLPSSSDPGTGDKRETAGAESEADTRVLRVAGDGGE